MNKDDKFNKYFITSKEEMLSILKRDVALVDERAKVDTQHSGAYYGALKDGIIHFAEVLENKALPQLTEPFAYVVYVKQDRIVLKMIEVVNYEVNDEIKKRIYDTEDEYDLISIPFKLLSLDDYAKLKGTTMKAVWQWIRRGKIKSAKKLSRDWYIPEIAEVTKKQNEECIYTWKNDEVTFDDEFKNLNGYTQVTIKDIEDDKTNFMISLYDEKTGARNELKLSTSDKEKLEVMLIGNDKVHYRNDNILVIG